MQVYLSILIPVLIAAAGTARAIIQTKVTPARLEHVQDIARVAVRGAEQLGNDLKGLVESSGAAKLTLASEVVITGAKRLGIRLSPDEATTIVTAALREMEQLAAATSAR